jgi:hypothetical protein
MKEEIEISPAHQEIVDSILANRPQVVCAWHPQYFGTSLILQAGNAEKRSDSMCDECKVRWDEIALAAKESLQKPQAAQATHTTRTIRNGYSNSYVISAKETEWSYNGIEI